MLLHRRPPRRPSLPGQSYTPFVQREFQTRYIGFLLSAVLAAMIVAGGPSYYFLNQNYDIFTSIAYNNAPQLLTHLERERIWINGFLFSSVVGVILFCIVFGLRLTRRIIRPLAQMEAHLKLLTRGHWNIGEIQLEEESEFFELIETYNYFYKALKANTQLQLSQMRKITVDRNDRDSLSLLQNLIRMKAQQLEEATVLTDAAAEPSPDWPRAS